MKKNLLLLSFLIMGISYSTQAQLLKKLKDKAAKALDPKSSNSNAGATNSTPEKNEQEEDPNKKTKVKWTPSPDDQKLFSLEDGETFLYDETKVTAINGKLSYAFVTVNKQYQYFMIEDGKRSGPFKEAPVSQLNIVSDKNEDEDSNGSENDKEKIELGNDHKDPVALQYSKTISNKLYIVFNGKNYGPYDYVAKMRVSPDKKKFWAAVVIGGQSDMMTKMGMGNSFLVNEAGAKQKCGDEMSMAAKMMVSQNFGAAGISVMDNKAQKAITISSAGKTQEGSITDIYSNGKSVMLIADNGDIVSVPSQSPTQLLVNGNEAASFTTPVTNMRRLFIMPDYKKSVYYAKGKLHHGDGTEEKLSGVTFPKIVMANNQPVIYYYKIFVNDNGAKDVYLCKKVM